ncbi:MAG: UDP-4-amino-4,6-dideoxy-N-acetyl-beta-L-altrosamine transaminase [Burkholderiaceae bacterium]|nr:MAG: UDP-4-amino-4,6-dideoxy-N-acetyl-beta-L-altrosamine transaminase [Burkholderiaceae bacterium]
MISYGRHHIDEADIQAVVDCLRSGALTQGPRIAAFEQAVAAYVGARYAVAVSSGTAALHIAALAAGVGPKSALVTSPITFVASANAALYVGARPVFADVDPATANISPAALAETLARNPDVKAVIPVHYAGLSCDMPAIKSVADRAGAVVIEDAAHALGARYANGQRVGCCADSLMTIFSFHPVKSLTTGEGGMVTTNDEETYRKLLRLRSHGINKGEDIFHYPENAVTDGVPNPWYYEMFELGFHYRITDIQCALGLSQLAKLDRFVARRRQLALRYDQAFADSRLIQPAQMSGRESSAHHLYPVRIDFSAAGISRATLMKELRQRGIICQVHYIPVPAQPYYRSRGFNPDDYPNAQAYYRQTLSIPLFYELTDQQQDHVIAVLKEFLS